MGQCPFAENFLISKWRILVDVEVLNLKFFFVIKGCKIVGMVPCPPKSATACESMQL